MLLQTPPRPYPVVNTLVKWAISLLARLQGKRTQDQEFSYQRRERAGSREVDEPPEEEVLREM